MCPLDIELKKIFEHDMDLLIIEEFVSDKSFASLFLNKLGLSNDYELVKAMHSQADEDGESDITLILQYAEQKVALLIEDKIDAPTMQEQSQRYHKRAHSAMEKGEYDSYYVMLVAPEEYHKEHIADVNAQYAYRVYYEELRDYFAGLESPRALYKKAVVDFALQEKKVGYQVIEKKAVTDFWIKLRRFCRSNYPKLDMLGEDSPKGADSSWPEFRTMLGNVKIIYKSPKGYVDLMFRGYGDKTKDLMKIVGDKMTDSMTICQTGKSASVRIAKESWRIDFSEDFEKNQTVINEVLQAVSTLYDFAAEFNYSDLY